jgi:hypothetical protein
MITSAADHASLMLMLHAQVYYLCGLDFFQSLSLAERRPEFKAYLRS